MALISPSLLMNYYVVPRLITMGLGDKKIEGAEQLKWHLGF